MRKTIMHTIWWSTDASQLELRSAYSTKNKKGQIDDLPLLYLTYGDQSAFTQST